MTSRQELAAHLRGSKMYSQWHWFAWHFSIGSPGDHPFAGAVMDALLDVDTAIPGFATSMADELASISGRMKHEPHYEQLLQRLAELHIIRQVIRYPWSFPATFVWEPTPGAGKKKNPEIQVNGGPQPILVEVKAPSLLDHIRKRGTNPTQLSSRLIPQQLWTKLPEPEAGITLPRDNPVKDFLISAEAKFAPFKALASGAATVLVIVWDDFIYEPISALLSESSGLFTEKSFARDSSGNPLVFPSVDGVMIVRHLHQLIRATRDKPLVDACRHPFDYGSPSDFPPKAYVANPHAAVLPAEVIDCFQAHPPSASLGAEYVPSDIIWWI